MTASRARGGLPERLLECTTAIIRERGLAFVSLRAVARRARVSHGAPAHHFRDKAALLSAYATQGYERMGAQVMAALARLADDDPRRRLETAGVEYVRFAIAHPEQFAIMFRTELHRRDDERLRAAADGAWQILVDAIAKCVAAGLLPANEARTAAVAAWSIAHGFAELWRLGRLPERAGGADPDALVRAMLRRFVDAMMPGPAVGGARGSRRRGRRR